MNWLEFFKNLGITGILTTGAVWLSKILITNFFSKDLEKFKADLEKEAFSYRIRYEKIYSEQADAIKKLYKKIVKTHRSFYSFMNIFQKTGDLPEAEKGKIAAECANDFTNFYEENRIFLDKELAKDIDKLSKAFRTAWIKFEISRSVSKEDNSYLKFWDDAWKIIDEETPEIKKNIEKKFRKIIGIRK